MGAYVLEYLALAGRQVWNSGVDDLIVNLRGPLSASVHELERIVIRVAVHVPALGI